MVERKNYGITQICEAGKGKFNSGAADFDAAARRSHGFHTRPETFEMEPNGQFAKHVVKFIPKLRILNKNL